MFDIIVITESFFWRYIGWLLIITLGLYLTWYSRIFQCRAFSALSCAGKETNNISEGGIHPLKLYFTSIGGMVGLGNVVSASVAMMIGGPGSIFWMVIASFFGMIIKYSEVYLGVKYRKICASSGKINGGPMFVLRDACKLRFLSYFFAIIMCLYGIEIFLQLAANPPHQISS